MKDLSAAMMVNSTKKAKSANFPNDKRQINLPFRFTQTICAFLIISILTVSVPAAPVEVKAYLMSVNQNIRIALLSGNIQASISGWMNALLLFLPAKKQTESIGRIEIAPGGITRRQGEPINFNAIGYTTDGKIAGGLKFKWTVKDVGRDLKEHNLPNGTFQAQTTGKFLITAEAGGLSAQVNVTVEENIPLMIMKKIKKDEAKGDLTLINKLKEKKQYTTENISSKKDYKDKKNDKANNVEARYRPIEPPPTEKSHGPNAGDVDAEYESANHASDAVKSKSMPMMRPIDEQGWDGTNWYLADDPDNQIGAPPGTSPDTAAGNGNFQLSAPVITLPGRGIDVNLSLNYNSRLWSKTGSGMSYDSDRGFPAPGWSLGFGKMMFMGAAGGCMMVDADGTRHGYTGTTSTYGYSNYSSTSFSGHTADGAFIDYDCYVSTYNGTTTMSGSTVLPNGSRIQYYGNSTSGQQAFPTQITDAQGNYINISYRNGHGPEIQTVTDTMGRVVTFNYDSSSPSRLISVTTPTMDNAGTRTVVRLHYKQITLNPGFSGLTTDASNWSPYVIDAIYYPGTNTGYWFNDTDSYSSYGMIAKVIEQRGMSWSGAAGDQGTVTPATMSKQAVYNYPLSPDYTLTDAPTYSTLTESWAGMDTAAAVTSYDIHQNSTPRTITVTQPNGVKSEQLSFNHSGQWDDGLIYQDRTLDAAGNQLSKSVVTWGQGAYDTARPAQTEVTDEKGQTLKTVHTYGTNYNQLISQKEYDYNGTTLLKDTQTSYENNSAYINRHIFNLVKTREIFDGAGVRKARTEYEYDNNAVVNGTQNHNLKETPGVTMHLATSDPYTTETRDGACLSSHFENPQCEYEGQIIYVGPFQTEMTCISECTEYEQVSAYDPNSIFRGNVTKVTSYTDASPTTPTGPISQTKQYDDTGNLVAESASCCQLKTYVYDDPATQEIDTQYAYPVIQTRGSSDPNSTVRNTNNVIHDFFTGLVKQVTDPNGRTDIISYDSNTLRPIISTSSTGAYKQTIYDEDAMTVTEETHEYGGNLTAKSITYLNGVGQVVKQQVLGANNVFDTAETKYTNLGQVWKRSNLYRVGDTVQWMETVYDLLGRTKQTIAPDGSVSQVFYNEAGAGQMPDSATTLTGNTIRVKDAWGRERWGRYDAQERLAEIVEANPNSDGTVFAAGSLITKYTYDTLGNLTQTQQGVQNRYFKYDSLGRLTRQKMAEQTATLNDAGTYIGAGQSGANWSEAFIYDERSNVTQKTDARGVRTYFRYQDNITGAEDPLNRLQAVTYDLSGPHDTSQNINAAFNTVYEYMPTGDQDRIKKINSTGLVKEEYAYDSEGRVSNYTQTVTNRENFPMQMTYGYDSLSRVKDVYYPAAYGLAGCSPLTGCLRKHVQNTFDVASRLSTLTVDGQQQAGDILFNAASQATSINIGTAGTNQVNENYTFDPQTGLLTNQKVQRGGQTLLDLSYDYQRGSSVGNTTGGKSGQLTKISDNLNHNRDRNYQYDGLGRLTKAIGGPVRPRLGSPGWNQQYVYDRYGNRQSVTVSGNAADNSPVPIDGFASLSYDTNTNRITNAAFQYDSAGNQTRTQSEDGSWLRFEYDTANRLSVVRRDSDGAALQAYQYSASNGRLMNYDYLSGEFILYANDGGTTVSEYHEYTQNTPTWTKSYVHLGDRLLSTITPNGTGGETTDFNHSDTLGTRTITNQSAGTSTEQAHLSFGTALNAESTLTTNKNRFTSYDRNTRTGLDYAVNRNYDSKQGRFTQVDPIGFKAASLDSPQTFNLYNYCGNDPINHTDPDGLFWGAIGRFFSAIGRAINRVLGNIVVQVALTVLAAVVTFGTSLIASIGVLMGTTIAAPTWLTVASFISTAASWATKIGTALELTGLLLQGKFRQLGRIIGMAFVGAVVGILEDSVVNGAYDAFKNGGNIFAGAWSGFKEGLSSVKAVFTRKLKDFFIAVYGLWCGPGYGVEQLGSNGPRGVDERDNACRAHDTGLLSRKAEILLTGSATHTITFYDWKLIKDMFKATSRPRFSDIAFGSGHRIGDIYGFTVPFAFGIRIAKNRGR